MFKFGPTARVFKSEKDQEAFSRDGFVVKELLSPEQVKTLLELFENSYPDGVQGFYSTTFHTDPAHRQMVHDSILKVATPKIQEIFQDFKVYFGSFIVKGPGPKSELIVHQDMTLVDESKFNGINIWCPLVQLTDENGAIEVLPGSHRLHPTYRGSSLPDIYDGLVPQVKHYLQSMKLSPGTAIIFDQSIIHYSPPNNSGQARPVINIFVTHQDARIQICYHNKEKAPEKVEIFEQEDDFVINFQQFGKDIFSRPKMGRTLGFFDYDFPKLSPEELEKAYGPLPDHLKPQPKPVKKPGFFARLFGKK